MSLTIEQVKPGDAEKIKDVFKFILPMAREVAQTYVDVERAFTNAALVMEQGHTFVARNGDGEIVGSLGLIEANYWYGSEDSQFLLDRWFYVRPADRFGDIGVKLMRHAKAEANRMGINAFIVVANPDRTPKQNSAATYSVIAGFSPFTHVTRLNRASNGAPSEPEAD